MATEEQQTRNQRGVSRVLAKLETSIEAGNYYEAHQMYRTLYFRYTAQDKFDDCLKLLYSGAIKLVAKQQETSAGDLGLLLVDTLEKRGGNDDADVWIDRLSEIIGRLSVKTVERETLINRAVKWSGDISSNNLGHPKMHKCIAQIYWAEGNTEQARHHFLLCRDGNMCGHILIRINVLKGFKNETDLFIVQAVLQQLCLKDRSTAGETFLSYTKKHPQIMRVEAPFKQPLLNFICLLLRSIDLGRVDTFRALCDLYKPSLSRDTSFAKYLAKVGVLFFGISAPRSDNAGGGGLFGDFFTRVFQDWDEDADVEVNLNDLGRRICSNTNELD